MVKFWEIQRKKGIAITKRRIKHHEKHGNGIEAMADKKRLVKQEEHHKRMMDK